MTNAQIVTDGVIHILDVYDTPQTRAAWYEYLNWVRLNYQPHLKKLTIGQLVDMHLADLGLTRGATRASVYLYGSQEDLMAWMLSHA